MAFPTTPRLEGFGRFLLRGDTTGAIAAGVAWLLFLQVERRLPPQPQDEQL